MNIVSLSNVSKGFGAQNLFENLSLNIEAGEKVAVIGKNGAGKSTLLKIISGMEPVDSGSMVTQKNLRTSYVRQSSDFSPELSVFSVVMGQSELFFADQDEAMLEAYKALTVCGFENTEQKVSELSGGWQKRLAVAVALVVDPELLLLDEPTNHMDWKTMAWLEKLLKSSRRTIILISHDRHFLNQTTTRTIEIGKAFQDEHLSFPVKYDEFILKREEYFVEQQKQFESLSNKARRELEWLRAGVKARTTKSRSRIKEAHQLFDKVDGVNSRIKSTKTRIQINIDETGRKSKKLIELKEVTKHYDSKQLFTGLNLILSPGSRLGLLGDNGSGKSTLVKIIMSEVLPDAGDVKKADQLRVVYFDQSKSLLDVNLSIFEFLAEGSEHVIFKDESMHVASYASKFLFTQDHYFLKISQLSGGERARLQLAKILLKPCDVLILDEPTNDLDIDSIESLENMLTELKTALVLISHDKSFLTQVCDQFLALEGLGVWNIYAEPDQWIEKVVVPEKKKSDKPKKKEKVKKMSYNDKKELASIERKIETQEARLDQINEKMQQETELSTLQELTKELEQVELKVKTLYQRWQELEELSAH